MDSLSKALALARLGIKVFPCKEADRQPLTEHGFYDATIDFELIATWFSLDFPDAVVGVWTGGSELIALDIDRKNGKDGFRTMAAQGVEVNETYHYTTATGKGEHHIWQSDDPKLTLVGGVLGKDSGIDIRAGGSYFVWWGDEVPANREAFSEEIPPWIVKAATPSEAEFTGEGFSGTVKDWLNAIPDDVMPSSNTGFFLDRIPAGDFGHPEMVNLVWELVRLGSERETGIAPALDALKAAWLRYPYNTEPNRRDFDVAIRGAINKAGRVQKPLPAMQSVANAMEAAVDAGVGSELKLLERKVSETASEIELARTRKQMFKIIADAGLPASVGLGVVAGSKSFGQSKVSLDSAWFGDGEPSFHDKATAEEADAGFDPTLHPDDDQKLLELVKGLSFQAAQQSFLTEPERVEADAYKWWGNEYLAWIQTRLKHFNKPYHVGAMWAALSVIVSPWGKVPLQGYKPTDCNLYINILGDSSSGKSEAWGFGKAVINAVYGTEPGPIIGDVKKSSAMSMHRTLILRDGQPTLVYSDEVQGFFIDLQNSHWQGTILADLSDVYGGDVSPKNTMNDKEISGKSAKSLLTTYLTGIADMSLDAISIDHWRSGLFYRFLWGFGEPRKSGDYKISMETSSKSYTDQVNIWAQDFKRLGEAQKMKWGEGRVVMWEDDALERIEKFNEDIDNAVKLSPLYDTVMIPANGRFLISVMKCATIVALAQMSETVKLEHVLVAINYAGPWHRSMTLAIAETGKDAFEREVEKAFKWIKRNAVKQLDKRPFIQRSVFMRAFRPNEVAERLLRQLVEEGYLAKAGAMYEITEG